ncbi:MAG: TldD/PmbA family protein [Bacillota bacterium]
MVGRERALELLEKALQLSPGDQTEIILNAGRSYLTRFAENQVHQNVGESNTSLRVKVIKGKKIGTAATNALDDEGIAAVVKRAAEIADLQRDNPRFVSLPEPEPLPTVDAFSEATAATTPEERAQVAGQAISQARENGLRAAGSCSTQVMELAIANSLGVRAYNTSTNASLSTVVMSDSSAGYAAQTSREFADLDGAEVGRIAVRKALDSLESRAIEPGEYEVILEPAAVMNMISFLAMGFSAVAYNEGRSFLSGKLGQQIVGENITIWDDGLDPRGHAVPFDLEGIPKRRLMLVEKGVAKSICYDSFAAHLEPGKRSTGHSVGMPQFGAIPTNIFIEPGLATVEEMIASTRRGILVTRFHYVNTVHPVKAIITGMTRDGTFLVEDGRIVGAIKNMRFTESVLRALSHVELIGSEPKLIGGYFGGASVPAMKISKFTFTGVTEH